jgi:2',3'-cyclic-nucleotide 2'-phosphodiesterase (5'-nucleotidase family)
VTRVAVLLTLTSCLAAASVQADGGDQTAAAAAPRPARLTVLHITDLYGRFADVDCDRPPPHTFAHLVGGIQAVRAELAGAGGPPPLVLNGGDNIGPRAFARYLLARGAPGGRELAGWMRSAGFDLVALGNQDFYAVPERLRAYLEAGRRAGLVFSAANLDCTEPGAGLCPLIGAGPDRYRLIERAGLRIALFSVIHGALDETVDAAQLAGLKLVDPYQRAAEVTMRARRAGADLVIAVSHLDHSETSPRKALALARRVPDLDLIVANAFAAGDSDRGLNTIRFSDGASPIVGCDLFGEHLCRTDLQLERGPEGWRVAELYNREIDVAAAEPAAAVQRQVLKVRAAFCRDWNKPVGAARLAEPMGPLDFLDYLLEIMRHTTRSELAFANRGLVDPRTVFPLAGELTRRDFFAALPHRNRVFTFTIDAAGLTALCQTLAQEKLKTGRVELRSRGLDCGDPANGVPITVNGRPLESNTRYSAATIGYLAKGMLGYFEPHRAAMQLYRPRGDQPPPVLGRLAREYLAGPAFSGPDAQPIDLERNFPDLARELRWVFDGGLNLNLADTRVTNGPDYEESQLTRKEFLALKAELRGSVVAASSLHALSLAAVLKYARSNTEDQGWIESEDLTTVNALYKLNALRDGRSGWYVPAPYVEGKLETELTRPEDDPATPDADEGRGYHHLELTGTLGARFPLLATLEAKLGFGVRKEMLDEAADATYGFDLGYKLARTDLFTLLGSPFQMESELSVFFGDIGRDNTLKGTWTNRLYFALVGPIFFNISHDLFIYRFSQRGYGIASDLTFGLSYNARATVQSF